MSTITNVSKVRLREGSRVSKSIMIRPGKVEKLTVKVGIPIVGWWSAVEVEVNHSDLVGKEFGASFQLRDPAMNRMTTFTLERSPLLDAALRRLSHYVDTAFEFVTGLSLLVFGFWIFGMFIKYVWIPIYRALRVLVGNVSAGVLSSRSASVLVGVALFAVAVVGIGFLLAIGWKLADKVRKKS